MSIKHKLALTYDMRHIGATKLKMAEQRLCKNCIHGKINGRVKKCKTKDVYTNLGVLFRDSIKDGSVCALRVATRLPRLGIALIALGKTFRAKIVGIAKRLVYTLKCCVTGHEDLDCGKLLAIVIRQTVGCPYPLEGCGAGPRMSSHKDGLLRHLLSFDSEGSVFQVSLGAVVSGKEGSSDISQTKRASASAKQWV
jgi:hypothetical protein